VHPWDVRRSMRLRRDECFRLRTRAMFPWFQDRTLVFANSENVGKRKVVDIQHVAEHDSGIPAELARRRVRNRQRGRSKESKTGRGRPYRKYPLNTAGIPGTILGSYRKNTSELANTAIVFANTAMFCGHPPCRTLVFLSMIEELKSLQFASIAPGLWWHKNSNVALSRITLPWRACTPRQAAARRGARQEAVWRDSPDRRVARG
jgi:hypothetical protein